MLIPRKWITILLLFQKYQIETTLNCFSNPIYGRFNSGSTDVISAMAHKNVPFVTQQHKRLLCCRRTRLCTTWVMFARRFTWHGKRGLYYINVEACRPHNGPDSSPVTVATT